MSKKEKSNDVIEEVVTTSAQNENSIKHNFHSNIEDFWNDDTPTEEKIEDTVKNPKKTKKFQLKTKEVEENNINDEKDASIEESKIDLQDETKDESNDTKEIKPKSPEINIEKLQKSLKDTKDWGTKKNIENVNLKRNITQILDELEADDLLFAEKKEELLKRLFNNSNVQEISNPIETKEDPIENLKKRIQEEFSIQKKYVKQENADDKYNAFFQFFNLRPIKEQEEILNYMLEEEQTNEILDFILHEGDKYYETLSSGMKKHGGIVEFVNALQNKNKKLEEENQKYKNELDDTIKEVYYTNTKPKMNRGGINESVNNRIDALGKFWEK